MVDTLAGIGLRAQALIGTITPPASIPRETSDLTNMIRVLITTAYSVAGVVSVAFIIIGGYYVLTSTGDAQKMKKGTDTVLYAVAGMVIVLASGLLFNFIARKLGIGDLVTVLHIPTL